MYAFTQTKYNNTRITTSLKAELNKSECQTNEHEQIGSKINLNFNIIGLNTFIKLLTYE